MTTNLGLSLIRQIIQKKLNLKKLDKYYIVINVKENKAFFTVNNAIYPYESAQTLIDIIKDRAESLASGEIDYIIVEHTEREGNKATICLADLTKTEHKL